MCPASKKRRWESLTRHSREGSKKIKQKTNDNKSIWFGPAGNSELFYEEGHKHSWEAPAWLSGLGLNAYEYSFGRGVRISQEAAEKIRVQAEQFQVRVSVHMPYYINLATQEAEKQENTRRYFLESLRAGKWMGASRAVFHPGSAAGTSREAAQERAIALLADILHTIQHEGYGEITLCPETMGKINQLGDLNEVLALCKRYERLTPCIDFGHLHARGLGAIRGKEDYARILDTIENMIGRERARRIHIHFSRIEYSGGGEKRHHTFADTQYGPEFMPLAELLQERRYTPVVICESKGTMAEDAVRMKQMYAAAAAADKSADKPVGLPAG